MKENSLYDKKSLSAIIGKSVDWNEVAKDCVAFSNAQGGVIDYGIEDDSDVPPIGQMYFHLGWTRWWNMALFTP